MTDPATRNHVQTVGEGPRTLLLAHGFGCDQTMWRFIVPSLAREHRVVLFDYTGCGHSDRAAFDPERYSHLDGYADDLLAVAEWCGSHPVTVIGHSVSGAISMMAAQRAPERFDQLIQICPSPCYLNDPPDYHGGFEREELDGLLDLMERNYIGWAHTMAAAVMHDPEHQSGLTGELGETFCSTDPQTMKAFARATFFTDFRDEVDRTPHPCDLIQSAEDPLAPPEVGAWLQRALPRAALHTVGAVGHCPHMSAPEQTLAVIASALDRPAEGAAA